MTVRNIIVGVTGGIAAYKTVFLVRLLCEAGYNIRVVMTDSAQAFVTPLTFQAISGHRIYTQLIDDQTNDSMAHIDLARWADLILVAPATANFIAKCANGFADDLLSTLCMATKATVVMAPAMNCQMWAHSATSRNVARLKDDGVKLLSPEVGELACGDVGAGRMCEPESILQSILSLQQEVDTFWEDKHILITAGPTHEPIDPIRYLGNRSSGKMGYALAESAAALGAQVTMVSGPTQLALPDKVEVIAVKTAEEMQQAVMRHIHGADIFVGAAAVANYRLQAVSGQKIKSDSEQLQLTLVKNPDIIKAVATLAVKPYVVGFAAETQNVIQAAKEKLSRKKLDLIFANQVSSEQGMAIDDNAVEVFDSQGAVAAFTSMPKKELAPLLLSVIKAQYKRT